MKNPTDKMDFLADLILEYSDLYDVSLNDASKAVLFFIVRKYE